MCGLLDQVLWAVLAATTVIAGTVLVAPAQAVSLATLRDTRAASTPIFADRDSALEWMEEAALRAANATRTRPDALPLERLDLFRDFDAEELATVRPYLVAREFPAGTAICLEGDGADRMWIITKGGVSIRLHAGEQANRRAVVVVKVHRGGAETPTHEIERAVGDRLGVGDCRIGRNDLADRIGDDHGHRLRHRQVDPHHRGGLEIIVDGLGRGRTGRKSQNAHQHGGENRIQDRPGRSPPIPTRRHFIAC